MVGRQRIFLEIGNGITGTAAGLTAAIQKLLPPKQGKPFKLERPDAGYR
jgi:hypothetical protein